MLTAAGFALAAFAAPNPPRFADKSPNAIPVDVELVIAVDVSYSMDPEEQALQRGAVPHRVVLRAARQHLHHALDLALAADERVELLVGRAG